ncbi:MAG TPA: hypothetical protein VER11_17370 [Polyangiaceae bacterium]|nr:hypothetical protein [Polyangiaceae bacterium]
MFQRHFDINLLHSHFFKHSCSKHSSRQKVNLDSRSARAAAAWSAVFGLALGTLFAPDLARAQDAPSPEVGSGADATSPAAHEVNRPGTPSGDAPLDFCANRPDPKSLIYQRQRVVVLNALVGSGTDAPETEVDNNGAKIGSHQVFQEVHAGELFRPVMMGHLPLPRLFMAFSRPAAPSALLSATKVSIAEAQAAAGNDDFLSYSLGCSDWLIVPSIERGDATWQKVEKEKTVVVNGTSTTVKYLAWTVNARWITKARLFQRDGDGFRYVKTFDADRGVVGGAAVDMSRGGGEDQPLHRYLSTWPTPDCTVGAPQDGRAGSVGQCTAVEPVLTLGIAPAELAGGSCDNDAVSGGASAMLDVARCAITGAASSAGKAIAFEEKQQWSIHAPLGARGAERVIPVGVPEGVHRGDYYVAKSVPGGYARVSRVGQGGMASPSTLKFKSGNPPLNTQMEELPLLGVQFGLRPGVLFLFSRGDLESKFAIGGEATVGYDLTRFLTWSDEVWARINVGYFHGSKDEAVVDIDAGFEGIGYFGGGVSSIWGIAYSALIPSLTRFDSLAAKDVTYSGASSGMLARLGLEFAFSPDWNMAITGEGRYGFNKADLKNEKESAAIYDGGHLAAVGGFLYVGHTL